jgi:hypothetical protein
MRSMAVLSLTGFFLGGCGAPPEQESESGPEVIATTTGELNLSQQYYWAQGSAAVTMNPSANNACFLAGLGGRFRGTGEGVKVEKGTSNWTLSGVSQQQGVRAWGSCFDAAEVSEPFSWSTNSATTSVDMGSSSGRVCYLTDFAGLLEGSNYNIDINNVNSRWMLTGNAANPQTVQGWTDLRTGKAQCAQAVANTAIDTYTWTQGEAPKNMGSTTDRLCVLTGVAGRFFGDTEWVNISVENGSWILKGSSQQVGVRATARCFTPAVAKTVKIVYANPAGGSADYFNRAWVSVNGVTRRFMGYNTDSGEAVISLQVYPPPYCNTFRFEFDSDLGVDRRTSVVADHAKMSFSKTNADTLRVGYEDSTDNDFNDFLVNLTGLTGVNYRVENSSTVGCN